MLIVKNLRKPNGIYLRNPSLPRDQAGNPLSPEQAAKAKAEADAKAKAEADAKAKADADAKAKADADATAKAYDAKAKA
jgi:hypothetical protein